MKKIIYALVLSLVVVSGLVFANREVENETSKKIILKPQSVSENKVAFKKWEDSPDGIMFKKWEASPEGKKVYASEAKIRKSIRDFSDMEGVITFLSLPLNSKLGFGLMVKINGDDYILSFGPEKSDDDFFNFSNKFEKLYSLKVKDKIIIRSHSVSHAPKYSYPIISGDYIEFDGKTIYVRKSGKDGC